MADKSVGPAGAFSLGPALLPDALPKWPTRVSALLMRFPSVRHSCRTPSQNGRQECRPCWCVFPRSGTLAGRLTKMADKSVGPADAFSLGPALLPDALPKWPTRVSALLVRFPSVRHSCRTPYQNGRQECRPC